MMESVKSIDTKQEKYREVFNTPEGEYVLKDLAYMCHLMVPTYIYNLQAKEENIHAMIFSEGERNIMMYILTMLKRTPYDQIERMLNEEGIR